MFKKLLLFVALFPFLGAAQHTITASFTPQESYNYIILYRVEPDRNYYVTDSRKDEEGMFAFKLDSTQTSGIYKVVYGIPQEEQSFDIIYNGKEDIDFTFSETEGITFNSSEENKLLVSYEAQMGALQQELVAAYQSQQIDEPKVMALFKEIQLLQSTFEKEAAGRVALNFIKANSTYIPDSFQDFNSYVQNRKKHHFDPIDFKNPMLQKSSFLLDTSLGYIIGFANPENPVASYKSNIDMVAEQLKVTDAAFQKSFWYRLWNELNLAKNNEASIYLADTYLLPTAKKAKDTRMVNEVFKMKNLTIGAEAPNFSWKEEKNGTEVTQWLSEVPSAKQYFLIFWSSGCSHCLQEVPKVHAAVKNIAADKLRVIAVGLEDDPYVWKDTIEQLPVFTHVLGLGKWENEIGNTYNISGTPTYIVLDSEKRIKAKPETLEELMRFISVDE